MSVKLPRKAKDYSKNPELAGFKKNAPTVRTLLRGWFHAGATPLVLASGIVLLVLVARSPEVSAGRILAVVAFLVSSLLLFGISSLYHIFNWSPPVKAVWRRLDHANIFLIIAGTYTPIAVSSLPWGDFGQSAPWYQSGSLLLVGIWILTAIGLTMHVIWISAPRWLYTIIYIVLGLASVIYLPAIGSLAPAFGTAIVSLVCGGGIAYIVGAIFYATKWPLRHARILGFHEIFHACTIAAFACHSVAIYLALLG